mmetsp:Transcript_14500/g.24576  ORF Transcript_14500/g.24576 Transcript_14500/m.24576 type:complete len:146 (-) Transcript_14500:323-760(-)|eukprot:CAMPEP_0198209592 /NCGR_PEP_ID=MMETSP1445-20131203/17278_1 /TAXON_ID=36898 /ORGANISM="Pyramimonas sp., Strain CCMP2087" /LENGTH=145 /DNA_ID=CAMNT_0043883431 /DNA_START=82 /DNA_END=519 /DNA_ORIENTATION=+
MTEVLRRGIPGMKSVKDMPVVQDMPPPGGFPAIRFGRRIANTGPSGAFLFGASALVMGFGFYKVGQTNRENRALKAEQKAARETLVPLLQAEEDRRYVEYMETTNKAEASIMGKTPNWKVNENVYNNGKWYPPVCSTLPGSTPFS